MATKRGTIYSNIIGQWQLATDVYEGDYDVASNTSPVTLKLYLRRAYTYYGENGGTYSGQIRFDGNWKANYSGTIPYPTGIGTDWFYLTEVNTTAYHNPDGSYSPNISISAWGDFAPFNTNPIYDGSITFSTIPRATPAVNVSCDVESTTSFTLTPYSGQFSHSVDISFADETKRLLKDGTTTDSNIIYDGSSGTTWNFIADKSYYSKFNKKYGTGSIIVKTYSGNTVIGTSTGTLTINANANLCSPVITGTVEDVNEKTIALTGDANTIVKYASIAQVATKIQVTAPNDNNATLTFLQVAGNPAPNLTQRTFAIKNPLNKGFLIKAINSRDFSTETVISAKNFIDYILPTVIITSAKRTEPTTGDATIEYKGDWFNNKFSENVSNTLTLTWKYKEKGQTAYTSGGTLTPTIKDNTFSGTINVDGLFNYLKQYDVIIVVEDKLTSVDSAVVNIPRGFPIFWWSENFVDILGELRINGNNPFLYSEDETVIGKWYDGKPLYQKVILYTGDISSTIDNQHAHGIENVDTIFIKNAFIQSTKANKLTYMLPVTQYGSNTTHDELSVCIDTTYYQFLVQSGWGGENWHIFMIVNYTKVTDSVANLMIEDETKPTKTI